MANFFSKGKVKVAQQSRANKFDFAHSHVTTMDFFQSRPVFTTLLKPNDSIDVNMTLFSRLSPLVKPFFGDIRFVNRAFFVPLRILSPSFLSFIEGTTYTDQSGNVVQPKKVPFVTNQSILGMFFIGSISDDETGADTISNALAIYTDTKPDSDAAYDFVIKTESSTLYYKFTYKGKLFFNILVGLGLKPNFGEYKQLDGSGLNSIDDTKFKAFPLLAYCKLHFDWLRNPAYSTYVGVEKYFSNDITQLSSVDLYELLNASYKLCYSADLFTSSWDQPVAPNNDNLTPQLDVPDLQEYFGQTGQVSSGNDSGQPYYTPATVDSGTRQATTIITDYMLQILHKMTDFVKRKQLVGSRVLDRYMSDYGVQLDSAKLDRSLYVGKVDVPVAISDIMQTSPDSVSGTSGSTGVGDYSGKGVGAGSQKLTKFTTDEWGIFMVLSYIEPRNSYPYGRNRQFIGDEREDFFISEFDAIGTQPIRSDELSALNMKSISFTGGKMPNSLFGFTPRYSEYKTVQDNLSGDFLLDSKRSDLQGWYLCRDFRRDHIDPSLLVHSLEFTEGSAQGFDTVWQYSANVSANSTDFFDHFYCRFIFDVTKYSHMCNLYDYHDFESDGKEMLMNINGTQVTS